MSRTITHDDFQVITGSYRIGGERGPRLTSILFVLSCVLCWGLLWMASAARGHHQAAPCLPVVEER